MNRFGFFYYSQKTQEIRAEEKRPHVFMRPLFSKREYEYTEWRSTFPYLPMTKWKDVEFIGIGFFTRVTPRPDCGLVGREAKDYLREILR